MSSPWQFRGKLPGFCIPGKGELLFKYGLKSPLFAHFPGRFVYGDDIALATPHKDLAQSVTAPTDGLNIHKDFLTTKRTNPYTVLPYTVLYSTISFMNITMTTMEKLYYTY